MSDRPKSRLPEDPSGIDQPHDVLAAEEFAMPMRSRGDVPTDPIHEPHDVLAAEEFAMPTAGVPASSSDGLVDPRTLIPALVIVGLVLLLLRRRRHVS
ncbi:MAG: hypothetical protein H0U20_06370 [Thermoleophilaceae bacterium]|nr:hypothetical protein [Thermoleophilaceae bacterium]